MAGTLWQTAQLAALNEGPSPSSGVSTSRKSSSPRRKRSNSAGRMPGSGSPNRGEPLCASSLPNDALPANHAPSMSTDAAATKPRYVRDVDVLTSVSVSPGIISVLLRLTRLHLHRATHEPVAGTAHARTLERVGASLGGGEDDATIAASAFGDLDVNSGRAGQFESMRRVFTGDAELDRRAFLHRDARRREGETLGDDVDDAGRDGILGPSVNGAAADGCQQERENKAAFHVRFPRRNPEAREPKAKGPGTKDFLEPPPQPHDDPSWGTDDRALVADVRVIELDGDVGIDPVGGADDPRVAIELRQFRRPGRHLVLRVEVLVADEHGRVVPGARGEHAVGCFEVRPAELLRDVRVDAREASQRIVPRARTVDEHLRVLRAALEATADEARIHFRHLHARLDSWDGESGLAAPETRAQLQAARADVLHTSRQRHVSDPRLVAVLRRVANAFFRGEGGCVERRHHVRAISEAISELAV